MLTVLECFTLCLAYRGWDAAADGNSDDGGGDVDGDGEKDQSLPWN